MKKDKRQKRGQRKKESTLLMKTWLQVTETAKGLLMLETGLAGVTIMPVLQYLDRANSRADLNDTRRTPSLSLEAIYKFVRCTF